MFNTLKPQKLSLYLIGLWWILALFSFLSALLYMKHQDMPLNPLSIFDMSFFYWIPAILWTALTPFLIKLYLRFPFHTSSWPRSILIHLSIAICLAFFLRVLALYIDFMIKYTVGMLDTPVLETLSQVIWVIPASAFKEMFYYFIVMGSSFLFLRTSDHNKSINPQTLTALGEQGLVPLALDDIYWLEANRNYIDIYSEKEKLKIRNTLSSLEKTLDPDRFIRIHRSYIINKNKIESLKHWKRGEYLIVLKNQKILTSSRSFHPNVQKILNH